MFANGGRAGVWRLRLELTGPRLQWPARALRMAARVHFAASLYGQPDQCEWQDRWSPARPEWIHSSRACEAESTPRALFPQGSLLRDWDGRRAQAPHYPPEL